MHFLLTGNQVKGKVIGTTLGCIQYCSFSPDDKLVAACCENDVIILEIKVYIFFMNVAIYIFILFITPPYLEDLLTKLAFSAYMYLAPQKKHSMSEL